MFESRLGEWSYYLGCASAAVAIVYRALWFGSFRSAPVRLTRSGSSPPDGSQHSVVCGLDRKQVVTSQSRHLT